MRTKKLMIIALALSLPLGSLLAQNDGPPPDGSTNGPAGGHRHRPPPMPIIEALDTNHDGIISAEEIANAPAALKTLDKNGDGQLTPDEYMPPHPQGGPGGRGGPDGNGGPPPGEGAGPSGQGKHHRPVPPIIAALDTNGDGIISADEIANASASLLKLDKNGDGQLTRDEYMPPRPPRRDDGPDGPPGGDGQRPPPDDGGQRPPPPGQDN
jgi:hypothetical protein